MSVFVKRQTHDIQKMKSFNQQREKERMRSICLLLLYFMLLVHNDVEQQKNGFKSVYRIAEQIVQTDKQTYSNIMKYWNLYFYQQEQFRILNGMKYQSVTLLHFPRFDKFPRPALVQLSVFHAVKHCQASKLICGIWN